MFKNHILPLPQRHLPQNPTPVLARTVFFIFFAETHDRA